MTRLGAATHRRRGRGGALNVYRAERRKLLAQLSTRVLALACLLGPLAFGAVLSQQSGVPGDTLLGVWVHSSGYSFSLVVLGFAGYLGFPLLAGGLAGDMFSSEDRYGTWKTILTRSRSRGEVFWGKLAAAVTLSLGLMALASLSSVIAGLLFVGGEPMVGLGGTVFGSGESLWLVLASWLISIPGVLGFASLAMLFSAASRNGIVGVLGPLLVGIVMQLLAAIGNGTWVHMLLLSSSFDDWHGLLAAPRFYDSMIVGSAVAVLWIVGCLGGTWWILRRREFAGQLTSRRSGWTKPVGVVLAASAAVLVLAAAASLGPAGVRAGRLAASIGPLFDRLTVLQQRELGRPVAHGAELDLRSRCRRSSGRDEGPGDDWSCTMTVVAPELGSEPFQLTPVTYDVSVKSNGCYKAEAPPTFVGQQVMLDSERHTVVNPLFILYGCFDLSHDPGSAGESRKGSVVSPPGAAPRPAKPSSGEGIIRETEESERRLEREAQGARPPGESPPRPRR